MPRRTRNRYRVRTPEHLLDVAARLFAERGYAAVTLKDVVDAAKVNGASVNYHFGDKQNLYRKIIERSLEHREQAAPLEDPSDAQAPEARLHLFIHALLTQLLGEGSTSLMARLMLREAIDPTVEFDRAVDELPRRQLRILDGIIAEIAGPGCSRQAIRRMSISILGQCVYYRYAEKFLKRIDPRLNYGKRTVHALAEHIYRFSLAAINGSKA